MEFGLMRLDPEKGAAHAPEEWSSFSKRWTKSASHLISVKLEAVTTAATTSLLDTLDIMRTCSYMKESLSSSGIFWSNDAKCISLM